MNLSRRPLPSEGRFLQQIAPTPLVAVRLDSSGPSIFCKLEFLNPSGSTKDRIARYILEKAWRLGDLELGGSVVEASSGSTSIAMALACAQMQLHFTAVMPEGVTEERIFTIRAYGGEVLLTPRAEGIHGAVARAKEEARTRGAFAPLQFQNPDNVEAHRMWTGQEILAQIPCGIVHGLASGVGTGGTLMGLYQAFTNAGCPTAAFVARPISWRGGTDVECCSFSSRVPGVVEGISTLYRPADLGNMVVLEIPEEEAIATTRKLIQRGFPVGPSSGLNYAAAVRAAGQLGSDAQVVTVFADRMERYFSSDLFHKKETDRNPLKAS